MPSCVLPAKIALTRLTCLNTLRRESRSVPQVSLCESSDVWGCTFQYVGETPQNLHHFQEDASPVWHTPVVFSIWPKAVTEGGVL